MNTSSLLAHVANVAPRFFQARRKTVIGIGIGFLVLFGATIWAALALMGWLWGQTQNLAGVAPEVLQGASRDMVEKAKGIVPGAQGMLDQVRVGIPSTQLIVDQVNERVPGARELLANISSDRKPEVPLHREVSGEDLGPVSRYAGLVRTQWQRINGQIAVEYEGKADYVKVLDYYSKGFSERGFSQNIQSAVQGAETHEYTKNSERYIFKIAGKPKSLVFVRIEALEITR